MDGSHGHLDHLHLHLLDSPGHQCLNTHQDGVQHRVGRVISFSPVVGIGTPPTPNRQAVPPLLSGGRAILAGERGWESPYSDEVTYTVVLYIYVCALWCTVYV